MILRPQKLPENIFFTLDYFFKKGAFIFQLKNLFVCLNVGISFLIGIYLIAPSSIVIVKKVWTNGNKKA